LCLEDELSDELAAHIAYASAGPNYEMSSLPQPTGRVGGGGQPADIYSEIKSLEREINVLNDKIAEMGRVGARSLSEGNSAELDRCSSEVMMMYRTLVQRFGQLKSRTAENSGPARQVGRVENDLKSALGKYNAFKSQYSKGVGEQAKRQLLVVRPDASQQEISQAVQSAQSGEQLQVFQQALQKSARQDAARDALHYVQDRHGDILKLERDMQELVELTQMMADMTFQQEELVMKIEEQTEIVNENLDKGVEEIGVAVNTARKTRKKKWICLGICGKHGLYLFCISPSYGRVD
jgi:syntaxin 1B/2/3